MTNERINHRAHDHANTKAARAICRREMARFRVEIAAAVVEARAFNVAPAPAVRLECTIVDTHCENCGSTDYESINLGDQGYSACCNELVTDTFYCRNHHG